MEGRQNLRARPREKIGKVKEEREEREGDKHNQKNVRGKRGEARSACALEKESYCQMVRKDACEDEAYGGWAGRRGEETKRWGDERYVCMNEKKNWRGGNVYMVSMMRKAGKEFGAKSKRLGRKSKRTHTSG